MSVIAHVRLAPLVTVDVLKDPGLAGGRLHYQAGAIVPLFPDRPLPVIVDHGKDREVGRVIDLYTADDPGGGRWVFARAEITDAPGWLSTRTGASFEFYDLQRQDMGGWTRILRAPITELSILSPGVKPAEPRASVVWIGEPKPAPSRRPVVDLSAFLTGPERAKLSELQRAGFGADTLRKLIEQTCRPRAAAAGVC